jgi:hypothetical protein
MVHLSISDKCSAFSTGGADAAIFGRFVLPVPPVAIAAATKAASRSLPQALDDGQSVLGDLTA